MRKLVAAIGIILGVIYIINPTAGVFELLPDNIPFVGNLDEAGAVWIILCCLREFGVDLTSMFRKGSDNKKVPEDPTHRS
jgi:uncharacterized membrane protein YkvA (DUF1232 family)